MTEAKWLACTDPTPMLSFLLRWANLRKFRLFGWCLLPSNMGRSHR